MEIALLHYAAPPIIGGVEHVIGEHARIMTEAGHHVRLIAGRGATVGNGVAVSILPLADSRNEEILATQALLDAGKMPANFGALVKRIEGSLKELLAGADVLIAHNVCSLNKNLALTAAVKRISEAGRPPRMILWHHDLAWTTARYRSELHPGYPWDLLCTDWPEAIQVCVSEWRRDELAELLGIARTRIRVIPNGLDAARVLRMEQESQGVALRLHLMQARPLILLPVRITPRKNIEMAMQVLAALRSNLPEARMLVTGPLGAHSPANVGYLERLIGLRLELGLESAVHFLAELDPEPLSDRAIADLYALADLLLLTSTEEGFGLPILEAGLSRIPIFCTDIAPLRELGGSEASYFLPGATPESAAAQITSSLESSSQYVLRKRVLGQYTWESIYSQHLAPLLERSQR
jgi:glycosyltransferase involved in cell wall biosynthesis